MSTTIDNRSVKGPTSVVSTATLNNDSIQQVFVGLRPSYTKCITATPNTDTELVGSILDENYDAVLLPITNPSYRTKAKDVFKTHITPIRNEPTPSSSSPNPSDHRLLVVPPPELEDVNIFPGPHIGNVIGLVSSWIELESEDPIISDFSLQVLNHELSYASFCGLSHVIIAPPKTSSRVARYAQIISHALSVSNFLTVSISIPICEEARYDEETGIVTLPNDYLSTWDTWNTIRTIANYNDRLKIALGLPKGQIPYFIIDRWFSEPVSLILISSSIFVPNGKNYPVLTKLNQSVIWKFGKKAPTPLLILHGVEKPTAMEGGESAYLTYIRHLILKAPKLSAIESFSSGYYDQLQSPLQPLSDNLENGTYETFEKDPVKYENYERAIYNAILDKKYESPEKFKDDENDGNNGVLVMAVVGAGRGPLVTRALNAARSAKNTKVHIYALEKNPNAIVYLTHKQATEWGDEVEIVCSDMRLWNPPSKLDIVISELLGSFGDNELAPECLDGVERLLATNGIMIPQSYTSHLAPAFSPKLYHTLQKKNDISMFHSPYVVMLQSVDYLSPKIQQCWEFNHPHNLEDLPNTDNKHNQRFSTTSFKIRHKGVLHGLVGFFECVLYKDIELSIRPDNIDDKSPNMISWFPIWFPLDTPLYLTDDTEIEVSMNRYTDGHKVWYEWFVETFMYLIVPINKKVRSRATSVNSSSDVVSSSPDFRQTNRKSSYKSIAESEGEDERYKSRKPKESQRYVPIEKLFEVQEEQQARIRTGGSSLHNPNAKYYSMAL